MIRPTLQHLALPLGVIGSVFVFSGYWLFFRKNSRAAHLSHALPGLRFSSRIYSVRSASIGSMEAARCAGISAAINPISASTSATPT